MTETRSPEPPKTILLAWELGANLGHVKPMLAIARALQTRGLRVVFAVRDLESAQIAIPNGEFPVVQSPIWPLHRAWGPDGVLANYVDLLTTVGFADPNKLAAMVGAWNVLLDLVQPSVVVADHAPALMVALYDRDIPVVAVGTPFTMPPLMQDRFAPLRADRAPALSEARHLQAVKKAISFRNAKMPASLVDLFRSHERLIFGIPELDPYRPFRQEPLCAPPEPLPAFVDVPRKHKIFVYLGAETPNLEAFVQALCGMHVDIVAYLRGDAGPIAGFLKLQGHTVHDAPPSLAETLPAVSHVISQGGAFTSQAALAAGRPHLVLTLQDETDMNLGMLIKLGVARGYTPVLDDKKMRTALGQFLTDAPMLARAREFAHVMQTRKLPDGLDAAQNAILRCLAANDQMRNSRLRAVDAAMQPSK